MIKRLKWLQIFLIKFQFVKFFSVAYANVFKYKFIMTSIMISGFSTEKNLHIEI